MIVKLKMCTTGKILVEMSVPETETSRLYILYDIKFKSYVKPYLKNLGV